MVSNENVEKGFLSQLYDVIESNDVKKAITDVTAGKQMHGPKTFLEKTNMKRRQTRAKSKKESEKWTPDLRSMILREELKFGETRHTGILYKPDKEEKTLLKKLESGGVTSSRNLQLGAMKKIDKIALAEDERKRVNNIRKIKLMLYQEQRKNSFKKRQKGKNNRRRDKKKMQKEELKIMEVLEQQSPEVIDRIKLEFDKKRANMRMMANYTKRKKWARLATKFGNEEAVADNAAKNYEEKREIDTVLEKINGEESSQYSSDTEYSESDELDGDSSDSEVSAASDVEKPNIVSSKKDPAVEEAKAEEKSTQEVLAEALKDAILDDVEGTQDLSHLVNPNENSLKAQILVSDNSEIQVQEEIIQEVMDDFAMADEAEIPGWGTKSWASNSFFQKEQEAKLASDEKKKKLARSANRVYINPKLNRKFVRYMTKPDNMTEEEAEIMHGIPLGEEWNTGKGYTEKIKPKYSINKGVVIEPLEHGLYCKDPVEQESIIKRWKQNKRAQNATAAKM